MWDFVNQPKLILQVVSAGTPDSSSCQGPLWQHSAVQSFVPTCVFQHFSLSLSPVFSPFFVSLQDQFEFALTAVAEEVNAILKALPQ